MIIIIDMMIDIIIDGGLIIDGMFFGIEELISEFLIYCYEVVNINIGGGYVFSFSYLNGFGEDELIIMGLVFDGVDVYSCGSVVSILGGYLVYDVDILVFDFFDGDVVGQLMLYCVIFGLLENNENG